jgi:hypothetical protein
MLLFPQVAMNPNNTIFDAKRLIGRKFDDSTVQRDIKHWPFTVINDNGKPKIQVSAFGQCDRYWVRIQNKVTRWHVFKPKILIWVNFGGTCSLFYGRSVDLV